MKPLHFGLQMHDRYCQYWVIANVMTLLVLDYRR
jgi:hypothetical protein